MENDILDSLSDIGYTGILLDDALFKKVVEEGVNNSEFRKLIVWISSELTKYLNLDESVNDSSEDDITTFLMETSSLLKELGCPFQGLTDGPVTQRLGKKEDRLLLLNYLLSEVMGAKILRVDHNDKGPELLIQESEGAKDLKNLLLSLQFSRPPDNITAAAIFSKLEIKLKDILSRASADLLGKPILNGPLNAEQWEILNQLQNELKEEYRLRREVLLKRLDVTIQSFQWSERAKKNEDAITNKFGSKRKDMKSIPDVDLADILSARQDLAAIEKTSSSSFRKNTQSSINKVIIGRVPDRGGRPSEQEAPPPEMPSWQKERAQGGGGGGGGNNRGGFSRGGGRVQGGWSDRGDHRSFQDQRGQQGYNRDDRGGYQDRRDGGYQDRRDYQDDRGHRGGGGYRGGGRGRGRGRDHY